jgi:16S rRNA (uracil1498-N3)-methyltransferase
VTEPLFLSHLDSPQVGDEVCLSGDEGHHAADVRRIKPGEVVLIGDGAGQAVRGPAVKVGKGNLVIQVTEVIKAAESQLHFVAVQALAKSDRAELAIAMLTEAGIEQILPWGAERSIVRWSTDRAEKGLARWRATVREAAKQSRRLRVPVVADPLSSAELCQRVRNADLALVLHESARTGLAEIDLPSSGEIIFIVGPEGGLTDAEVAAFTAAGGKAVSISDAVLRTSTAGVVALAQLQAISRLNAARGAASE